MQPLIRNLLLFTSLVCVLTLNTSFVDLANDEFTFTGYFGKEVLVKDKKYYCAAKGDSISVSMCRFYISKFELVQEDGMWGGAGLNYRLINLFDSVSRSFNIPYNSLGDMTSVKFYLGIDSATNVAGVGDGDLDPTTGMYWAWQSGFINMKLEGNSSICAKTKNEFQYHLGGYAAPNNALQLIELKLDGNGRYTIKVDVEQFFSRTDMAHVAHVMSPSVRAVELSTHAAKMFSIIE